MDVARATVSPLTQPGARERRCGGCGRGNDQRRELCAVCGADLETGLPVEYGPVTGSPSRPAVSDRRERVVLLLLGAVLVVASAVAPLAILGLGPFASADRLEPALLLRAGYPGPAAPRVVETVATTTTATAPDRDLSPLNVIDGDGATAWVGLPAEGAEAGEVVQLVLDRPAWVSQVVLRNGDHLSPAAYERSGRLQRGLLSFDGGRDHRMDLLDIGLQPQVVALAEPELTTRVTIRVDGVFPGAGSRGVALSEVTLVGWAADAADAALARQRAQPR